MIPRVTKHNDDNDDDVDKDDYCSGAGNDDERVKQSSQNRR